MNCRTCSAPLSAQARFCEICGTPVPTMTEPVSAADENTNAPTIIAAAAPTTPTPEAEASNRASIVETDDAANSSPEVEASNRAPLSETSNAANSPSDDAP